MQTSAPRLCRVAGRDAWHVYDNRRRVSTGETERAAAEQYLADYIAGARASANPAPARATVRDLLADYLADRKDARKPGAERLAWAHKPLSRILGDRTADSVTATDCRAYARQRAGEGVAPSTARTELQALRAALRWRMGPSAPSVELPPRAEARDRWLTRDEAARLVAAADRRHVRLFVLLALHTAARAGAILALTWDRVDLERRRIDYREPGAVRSKKRRVPVPVNDTLAAELAAAKERATCPHVVEFAGGKVASVKHGFRLTAERAGLDDVTPHTLRHTAATWMAQAGVPLWEVAGLLGHSDVRMIDTTYGHHSPDHLSRAARALG